MVKDKEKKKFDFDTNWYELWMKQSKEFYDSAEKNLKDIFSPGISTNPEDHMKLINQWLNLLKSQWQMEQFSEQQKALETYWKMMLKMNIDASDMMVQQWRQRSKDNNPINNIHELYNLWLNCCHEVYKNAMHSKPYQDTDGEFMNAAIHFWKSALSK